MDVVAEPLVLINGSDHFFDEIARMRCGETDAPQAIDFTYCSKKARKIPLRIGRIAIAVDILPEELHFAVSQFRQGASFAQDAFTRAAALRTASHRDDAVSA